MKIEPRLLESALMPRPITIPLIIQQLNAISLKKSNVDLKRINFITVNYFNCIKTCFATSDETQSLYYFRLILTNKGFFWCKTVVLNHGVAIHLCVLSFYLVCRQIIPSINFEFLVHVIWHLFIF